MRARQPTRVFISYAHESNAHRGQVRDLWTFLRGQGIDAVLDRIAAQERQDWALWAEREIAVADFVLVIASAQYRRAALTDAGAEFGTGVRWEARLLRDAVYSDPANARRILPVLLPGQNRDGIPDFLTPASTTVYTVREFTVDGAEPLLHVLLGQPVESVPPLRHPPVLGRRGQAGAELVHDVRVQLSAVAGELVSVTKLAGNVLGRRRTLLAEQQWIPERWSVAGAMLWRAMFDDRTSRRLAHVIGSGERVHFLVDLPVELAGLPVDDLRLPDGQRVSELRNVDFHVRSGTEDPREAATDIVGELRALDTASVEGRPHPLLDQALRRVGSPETLRVTLRRRGLAPPVLLPLLPGHRRALDDWSSDLRSVPVAELFVAEIRYLLFGKLVKERTDLGAAAQLARINVITGDVKSEDARRLADAVVDALESEPRATAQEPPDQHAQPSIHEGALLKTALRPQPRCFVGREALVATFTARLTARLAKHGSATAFLTGPLGSGVSTVANEAVRTLQGRFPGRVRRVDLRGLDEHTRLAPVRVAKLVIHSLGATPIPGSEIEQCRALMEEFKVLLVLDNALDARHVEDFVPAPPACAVVVTSRDRTQGYAGPGLVVHVPQLPRDASVELLSLAREESDRDALDDIARLCDDLPMALELVSAWIVRRHERTLPELAKEFAIESGRLERLDDGVRQMRTAIALSYNQFAPVPQRMFRFLSAVPASATAVAFADALECASAEAEPALDGLVNGNVASCRERLDNRLVEFWLPELVRLYAADLRDHADTRDAVDRFLRRFAAGVRAAHAVRPEPSVESVLDPSELEALRALVERKQWYDLAAGLTDELAKVYEVESDTRAVEHEHRRAIEFRELHRVANRRSRAFGRTFAAAWVLFVAFLGVLAALWWWPP